MKSAALIVFVVVVAAVGIALSVSIIATNKL